MKRKLYRVWLLPVALLLQSTTQGFVTDQRRCAQSAYTMTDTPSFSITSTALRHYDSDTALKATERQTSPPKRSKRVRFLNKLGFRRTTRDNADVRKYAARRRLVKKRNQKQSKECPQYQVTTVDELESYFNDDEQRFRNDKGEINYDALLSSLSVQGDTQMIGSPEHKSFTHPVAQVLHDRKRSQSQYVSALEEDGRKRREDGCRTALVIEGGGMRGCVSAGMICAIHHLNLTSTIDIVYGSSAGTIVGAYLITGQITWLGPEVYYDCLTTAGKEFIDTKRLLRAIGFGLVDPRLLRDVLTRPAYGKPVLNLPYLLKTTVQEKKPLNWERFVEKQKVQPLKVLASGCRSEKPVVMSMENGAFSTLSELTDCMHASCLLPGIAGPLMNLDTRAFKENRGNDSNQVIKRKHIIGNNIKGDHYEPLADALLFQPLPYETAIKEGATHVLVVRSRPDGKDVTGKPSVFEKLIFRRFFLRKNRLPNMFRRMRMQLHKKLYAMDILKLNEYAKDDRDPYDTSKPHVMTVALPPSSPEVTRLETGREAIFQGLRRGFARAYDCLVEDPAERGRGEIVAKEFFPDEILDYDPLEISSDDPSESAFEAYMRLQQVQPQIWNGGKPIATTREETSYVPDQQ